LFVLGSVGGYFSGIMDAVTEFGQSGVRSE
jgi:hypothetical protein